MASLSCLPNDLIFEILSLLDQNSITSLCQTSSNFNRIGLAKLKERIVIVPKTTNNVLLDSFELLQTFTYGFTKVKEDHFTDLYSRGFFNTTKELACLELYKRKNLQDYTVKLPQLQNFFTFDHRSYRWYEDFIQYRLTNNVNICNQYQPRIAQRTSLRPYDEGSDVSSDEDMDELDVGNIMWRRMILCNEESYDARLSDSEYAQNTNMDQKQKERLTMKLYTKMDEELEFFNFFKYSEFHKLQHLYLTNIIDINHQYQNLELISALFLCRYDRVCLSDILKTGFWMLSKERYSIQQVKTFNEITRYNGSTMMNLPINWKHLKELRFVLAKPCKNFSNFGTCFESLETLYVHDVYGIESQESILDFILNIKKNILRQIIIFAGGQFRKFQVRKYIKEKLKKILFQQMFLRKFTIRYGVSNSIEAIDLINLLQINARS